MKFSYEYISHKYTDINYKYPIWILAWWSKKVFSKMVSRHSYTDTIYNPS